MKNRFGCNEPFPRCECFWVHLWEGIVHPVVIVPVWVAIGFQKAWLAAIYGGLAVGVMLMGAAVKGWRKWVDAWKGQLWRSLAWGTAAVVWLIVGCREGWMRCGVGMITLVGVAMSRHFRPSLHAAGWAFLISWPMPHSSWVLKVSIVGIGGIVVAQRWICRRHSVAELIVGLIIGGGLGWLIVVG